MYLRLGLSYDGRMKILGIDPGTQVTGYGVVDFARGRERLVDAGVVRLDGKTPLEDRLVELETELQSIVEEHRPDIVAVEQLYAHYGHPRTAIIMGHARGVILLVARRAGVRIEAFPANRIKQSLTGHGHAGKQQMQHVIQSVFKLATLPEPPDVADALAVALCCGRNLSLAATLPAGSTKRR